MSRSASPQSAAPASPARVLVVVPVLDEERTLAATLQPVLQVRSAARVHGSDAREIRCIVVDGGSRDGTVRVAREAGTSVIDAPRGRAAQMNVGAAAIPAELLVFLHADTRLPPGWLEDIERALAAGAAWGRFDVALDDRSPLLMIVAAMMNLRSRWTGICTGDQAMFVSAPAWQRCGGYASIPLMEDIELSRRLKRLLGPPACLRSRVVVSARRWRRHGVLRTILLMWWLRLRYALGDSPARLHRRYYGGTG